MQFNKTWKKNNNPKKCNSSKMTQNETKGKETAKEKVVK